MGILDAQNATRLPELLPLRAERMAANPFAFYRGGAAIMAADLAAGLHTDLLVGACGDAHLGNFGFYASPQRSLVFDLNDFDEAAWAPWEWDLKRLVTSIVLAGQSSSRDETRTHAAVLAAVRAYALTLRASTGLSPRDRYYTRFDAEVGIEHLNPGSARVLREAIAQAKRRTGERAARKLTVQDSSGRMRFVERPPAMYPARPETQHRVRQYAERYLETVQPDIRQLMRNYVVSDIAVRAVGVGSVGTRCTVVLFQDGDGNAIVLQAKEAGRSVLEEYGGVAQPRAVRSVIEREGQGARVVGLQRILQAASDPFLGHLRAEGIDLYVRQFHDMKGGIDAEELEDEPFTTYAEACAITLARSHSHSPRSPLISGYLGGGRVFGEALLAWAVAYASRTREDYTEFLAAHGRRHRNPEPSPAGPDGR